LAIVGGKMNKHLWAIAFVLLSIIAFAEKVEDKGRDWLDAQKDPPAINVSGDWNSADWGVFHLKQDQGSRDVMGQTDGYNVTGVVSGKTLYMVLHSKSTVDYCATVTPDGDNILTGNYFDRTSRLKFGHGGLCQEKGRSLRMIKH
jgi:hypothetical protein